MVRMNKLKKIGLAALAAASFGYGSNAVALDKITVAYFLEWPTANQVAQIEKTYDKELGVKVEWRAFSNGNEMTQAMLSGDVQIAYSQGFIPFVVGVTKGAPLKMIGVAVTYAENDLCIIRDDSGITQSNAKQLEGKKIATPIGNVTHYKLLRTLQHLKVDHKKVQLVQMSPADAAVALIRGDVTMGCAFGGALARMKTVGKPLLTGAEQEAIGINTFDIITVTEKFAKKNPELIHKFMDVTEKANNAFKKNPKAKYATIAKAAGMDLQPTIDFMANFGFPTEKEQRSRLWLGGGVQETTKGVAQVMKDSGNLDNVLDDYSRFIDDSYLK